MAETIAARWERLTGNPGGASMTAEELHALATQRAGLNGQIHSLRTRVAALLQNGAYDEVVGVSRQLKALEAEAAPLQPVHCDVTVVLAAEIDLLEDRIGTEDEQPHDVARLEYLRNAHPASAALADANNP